MFEVAPALPAKTFFEIAGGKPNQRARYRVESVVQPRRRHAERAHVVADHDLILEPVGEIAGGPYSRGIRRAHEFVGDVAAVDVQPEREIAFDAARARQRSDAASEREKFIEGVLEVSGEYDLCALSLICV